MESISRIDRLRGGGSRQYVWAGVAAAALIAVVALAFGRLGTYVAFDGGSVGTKAEPDARILVSAPERRAAIGTAGVTGARSLVATRLGETSPSSSGSQQSTATGPQPSGDGSANGPTVGGSGSGAGDPPAQTPETGEPPAGVEPTPPAPGPAPSPIETQPVDVPPGPLPVPTPAPSSAPTGPLSATTAGLDQTLGALGVDLPVTELTDPVTEPADQLLDLLGGQSD